MTINNQDYEIHILRKVITDHLDQVIPLTDEGLNHLLSHHDDMVWNITTKIYSQSGYKLEFYFTRDVLNSWIEVLKERIAAEKAKRAEQARLQAERQVEQARIQAERQAEQARIKAGWQAKQPIIQAKRQAEQTRIEAERHLELTRQLEVSASDKKKTELFEKVRKIIVDQLCVESDRVTLSSHISNDLGADEYDTCELAKALEEELDIEIPYHYSPGNIWNFSSYSKPVFSHPWSSCVGELLDYIHQRISEKNLS
ncbi:MULTISPECIES: acyl carrier protein [unclassified Nodularia (in: cyanobacteria)]|uniref:acyl carrier protein n=1 Tax=unclassified Nodularia (in: cyanobacteria) TaxID=2656917 RepID=UPI001881C913|nr:MULTISPECIES: acyl carrier protein [unclassified Nodularia (in: cyanobacteria)]MBE9201500.1 hypothetical protein [Nodularia sp. LEGE 06071]MCC2691416.1 hypothetical protein [Nodularia sp. LEGE 04288]